MEKGLRKKRWLGILCSHHYHHLRTCIQLGTGKYRYLGISWKSSVQAVSGWNHSNPVHPTGHIRWNSPDRRYPGLSSPSWLSHTFYLPLSSCSRISEHYLMSLVLFLRTHSGFEQFASGGLGAVIMQGVRRGLFSNEAGMGSAPNAAATATVSHPVKQGLIQALSVSPTR